MRKVFLLYTLCALWQAYAWGQCPPTLDFSKYHIVFEDNFDSYNAGFKTDPAFITRWDTASGHNPCDGSGSGWADINNVSWIAPGIMRLTEHTAPSRPCGKGTKDHSCGRLFTNKPFYGSIGIIEARIKFPPHQAYDSVSAFPAFWLPWGKDKSGVDTDGYTEIDIIDNHDGSTKGVWNKIYELQGWSHTPGVENPVLQAFAFTETGHAPCFPSALNLADSFHTYSCLWTPSRVTFYLDHKYLSHFDFNGDPDSKKGRTFPDYYNIDIILQTHKDTYDGLSMDVDWVKYWGLNCDGSDFVLDAANQHADIMNYPVLPPDFGKKPQYNMIKNKNILLNNPGTNITTQWDMATMFEAESTTILANFLADESVPRWDNVTTNLTDSITKQWIRVPMPINGYFEIRPMRCGQDNLAWYKTSGVDNTLPAAKAIPAAIRVYPNPGDGHFTIEVPASGTYEVRVTDMSGSLVYQGHIEKTNKHEVHLDNQLPAGNYMVQIGGEGMRHVEKITVIR